MSQHTFKLCFFPGTCSRVSLIALEELNIPFETQLVVLMRGEHKSPDYLALNPKGKVPTLLVDGKPLTETATIIQYLNTLFPQAGLLPAHANAFEQALVLQDLHWLNSTVQPLVTGVVLPHVYCAEPEAGRRQTWLQCKQLIKGHMDLIERRLAGQPWLLGTQWSILDGMVWWIWDQLPMGGFDTSAYPHLQAHAERNKARPSIQRVLQREGEAFGWMASQGIKLGLPPLPEA